MIGGLIGDHGAAHIDGKHLIPMLDRDVARRGTGLNCGRMRQDIETTKPIDGFLKGRLDTAFIRDINVQVGGFTRPKGISVTRGLLTIGVVNVHANNVRAGLNEGGQRRQTHAASRTGHDDSFIF